MQEVATFKSHKALFLNTLAFTICFAAWMFNGVLVTFLVDNQVFSWGPVEIGWLMGIPVLTGSIFRLPAGMLTDKFGGKPVYGSLLIICAVPMYLLSKADSLMSFALCSFWFWSRRGQFFHRHRLYFGLVSTPSPGYRARCVRRRKRWSRSDHPVCTNHVEFSNQQWH